MLLNLYFCSATLFCISVFATMQSAAWCVANVELNYGEIMQPANQATCLHYTLQPTSIPIKQELVQCVQCWRKYQQAGEFQKYVALKGKTACSACIQQMSEWRGNFLHLHIFFKQRWSQIVTFVSIWESNTHAEAGSILKHFTKVSCSQASSIKWTKSWRCKWQWANGGGTVTMVMTIRLSPTMIRVPSRPTSHCTEHCIE